MTEIWSTPEQIAAQLAEFEAALEPHWEGPVAWGVMHENAEGQIVVDRAEAGDQLHRLALAVLATVAGDCCGTYVARLDGAEIDLAIAMLAPAEACTEYEHANLRTWRYLREEIGDRGTAVAVFTGPSISQSTKIRTLWRCSARSTAAAKRTRTTPPRCGARSAPPNWNCCAPPRCAPGHRACPTSPSSIQYSTKRTLAWD